MTGDIEVGQDGRTTYVLEMPYRNVPLTKNAQRRMHPQAVSREIAGIKKAVLVLATASRVPAMGRIRVVLRYFKGNNGRQDADGMWPTLSAAIDGLTLAKVVPDDTPRYVTSEPELIPRRDDWRVTPTVPRLELRITNMEDR